MKNNRHRSNDFVHTITKTLTQADLATDYVSPVFLSFGEASISFNGGNTGLRIHVQRSEANPDPYEIQKTQREPNWSAVDDIQFDRPASGGNRYTVRGKGWWRAVVSKESATPNFSITIAFAAEGLDTYDTSNRQTSGFASMETNVFSPFGVYSIRRNFPTIDPLPRVDESTGAPGVRSYLLQTDGWYRVNAQGVVTTKIKKDDPNVYFEMEQSIQIDGAILSAVEALRLGFNAPFEFRTPYLKGPLYLLAQPAVRIDDARMGFLNEVFQSDAHVARSNNVAHVISEHDEKNVFLRSYNVGPFYGSR